jgi:hypothetical protein
MNTRHVSFGVLLALGWVSLGCGNSGGGTSGAGTGGESQGGSSAAPGGAASGGKSTVDSGGNAGAASGGTASGGTASGGSPNGGEPDSGGSGGMQVKPPTKVNDCSDLAAPGVFEDITPPEVKAGMGTKTPDNQTQGGPFAMAVDPVNLGTIYSGTLFQGVWKSTDCGATFKKIATGSNGPDVNRGMNWTLAVDPQEPETVYTNSGYGSNGLFKSTDGGVNWTDIWSGKSQPELGKAFMYNFANVIAIDPENHQHILLTFHEACLAPHTSTCIVESKDGGTSWEIHDGKAGWNGGEGQVIFFLDSSTTWLWGSQTNGFWRTPDSGTTWEEIPKMTTSHLQGSQILRTKAGGFYAAGADGIWRSPDGKASSWQIVPDTGPILGGLVSTGTTMFASTCYFGNFCDTPRYLKSAETDGTTWQPMTIPKMSMGGNLGYDPGHKLLYSSNLDAGLWRVVVE